MKSASLKVFSSYDYDENACRCMTRVKLGTDPGCHGKKREHGPIYFDRFSGWQKQVIS